MLINNAVITGSFIVNGVSVTGITGSSELSSSYLALSSSYLVTSASYAVTSASYAQSSASLSIRTGNLEATSSTLVSASSSFAAQSASLSTRLTTDESNFTSLSSSFVTTSGSISSRVTTIEGQYATTGSNTFTGPQFINQASNAISFTSTASLYTDGGLRVAKDSFVSGTAYFNNITVYGTSSIEYITSSQVNIGSNVITVNTDTPAIRFGGLSVFDSGSTQLTGSLFWDSEKNHWIYSNPSGSSYNSAMLMNGPRNTGSLGDEQGTLNNYIMKGQGGDHITSSQIIDDGTTVQIPGNLQVTGSIVGSSTAAFASTVQGNGGVYSGTGASAATIGGKAATASGLTDKDLTLSAWYPTSGTNEYGGDLYLAAGRPTGGGSGKYGTVYIQAGIGNSTGNVTGSLGTVIAANNTLLQFFTATAATASPTERMRITSGGQIYNSNAPSGDWAMILTNSNSTAGTSYGLNILGGTNSSDTSFAVRNYNASSTYLRIAGDGAATFSSTLTAQTGEFISAGQDGATGSVVRISSTNALARNWGIVNTWDNYGDLTFRVSNVAGGNALSAGSTKMVILSSGNVGIGTSSPSVPLNVISAYSAGTTTTSLKLATIGGYNAGSGTSLDFGQDQSSYSTWLTGRISSPRTGDNWGGSLAFFTNDNSSATALVERMRITSNASSATLGSGGVMKLLGTSGAVGVYTELQFYTYNAPTNEPPVSLGIIKTDNGGYENGEFYIATKSTNANTAPVERMRITSAGNVGIGTNSPDERLTVGAGNGISIRTAGSGNFGSLKFGTNVSAYYDSWAGIDSYSEDVGVNVANLRFYTSYGSRGERMRITGGGNFYVYSMAASAGTNAVKFNTSTGQVTYDTSSSRYKGNIRDSIYGLNAVMQLKSKTFEYKEDNRTDIGLIAEEVYEVIPELVGLDKEGLPNSVSYDRFISVLVKAIQELSAKIDAQAAEINELKNK
jgi:hypothetical protein